MLMGWRMRCRMVAPRSGDSLVGTPRTLLKVILSAAAFVVLLPAPALAQWHGNVGVSVGIGTPYFYSPGFYPYASPYWGFGVSYSTPLPYPNGGTAAPDSGVRIQMTPETAAVYVDGYYAGTVENFNGTFQKLKLEPGTHDITIYLEGYRSRHEQVYVGPDSTTKITGTLDKLAPGQPNEPVPQPSLSSAPNGPPPDNGQQPYPPGRGGRPNGPPPPRRNGPPPQSTSGAVSIRVQPDSAEILIDGEHWSGRTNDRLVVQLSPGRHVVEIRLSGYRTFSTEVEIRDGQTTPLNISLTREN